MTSHEERSNDPRPCKGRNSNVCVAEGCYGEACRDVYAPLHHVRCSGRHDILAGLTYCILTPAPEVSR